MYKAESFFYSGFFLVEAETNFPKLEPATIPGLSRTSLGLDALDDYLRKALPAPGVCSTNPEVAPVPVTEANGPVFLRSVPSNTLLALNVLHLWLDRIGRRCRALCTCCRARARLVYKVGVEQTTTFSAPG